MSYIWQPCYGRVECTSLTVYLNFIYRDLSDNPIVCRGRLKAAFRDINGTKTATTGTCTRTKLLSSYVKEAQIGK